MFDRENSSNDCDTAPTEPPLAVEVEVGELAKFTAAEDVEPALATALLELCDEELEVDGAGCGVGWEDGVQVGQLVPPLLQVADALTLASARRAGTMMRENFTVGPFGLRGTAPGGA